jgi:hypothetical protein
MISPPLTYTIFGPPAKTACFSGFWALEAGNSDDIKVISRYPFILDPKKNKLKFV